MRGLFARCRWLARMAFALACLLAVVAAQAQAVAPGKRVALLIGNDKYRGTKAALAANPNEWSELSNAVNDARALGARLRELGFEVVVRENRNRDQMRDDIAELVERAKGAEGVLLYYSGHGTGIEGTNYLMPVSARAVDAALVEVHNDGIRLDALVQPLMALKGGTKIVVIDACRSQPRYVARRNKAWGSSGGMVQMPDPPDDTVIAFATDAGQNADDRPGEANGLYAHGLLKGLSGSDLSLARVLSTAEREVRARSRQQQRPKSYGSDATKEDFLFALARPVPQPADPRVAQLEKERDELRRQLALGPSGGSPRVAMPPLPGGIDMVALPYGRVFQMGSPDNPKEAGRYDDEGPQHAVAINHQLALGRTEVTRGQFAAFVRDTRYQTDAERNAGGDQGCRAWSSDDNKWEWRVGLSWRTPGFEQTDDHPVVCVSWNDAQAYIAWLNRQAGLDAKSPQRFRLPTEAEWEFAARAGTQTPVYWKDDAGHSQQCQYANGADKTPGPGGLTWDKVANCTDGYWFTAPVGKFKPNAWALQDTAGNAWEWVQDCYDATAYKGRAQPWNGSQTAPEKADCRRVLRGGSWDVNPRNLRAADRDLDAPGYRSNIVGFRLARTLF